MISTPGLPVHLWIYNHPFYGISDQIDFFVATFRQHGYTVSVGRQPKESSLNVVIEYFSTQSRDILTNFCRSSRKRVAVIMTEHLDFDQETIYIHGDPLWSDNDYMHPQMQVNRIKNLMDCLPWIRCFFVLGDLPELRNLSVMLPGVEVRLIPFPKMDPVPIEKTDSTDSMTADLLFTGVITSYRAELLAFIKKNSISVVSPQKFVSRKNRDRMNRSAKLILNIPQRVEWRWLSLMRIMAALRSGRATISLGTKDPSQISACCRQLDLDHPRWVNRLKDHVAQWTSLYPSAYREYEIMAERFEKSNPFPHDIMEFWALTDCLARPDEADFS